ncbi:MAG: DUF5596 domain-containing protein [Armatimonadetes bacterium]|nr:DUF5596 domain-containing protein [Armatimonadota bacterium]
MTDTTDLRDPTAVCAAVGLTETPEVWRLTWPQSARSFQPGVFFVAEAFVRNTCAMLQYGEGVTGALLDCAALVRDDAALERLAWHLHWLVSFSGLDPQFGQWHLPAVSEVPAAAMLHGLVALAGVPRLLEINAGRGIPVEVTIDTMADLETWSEDYRAWSGTYQFPGFGWLQHHLRGTLFQIGRLEYIPGGYYHPFRWYRHATSGQVIALAESDLVFREDGQFANADGGAVRTGLWMTELRESDTEITGHPCTPLGAVLPKTVTLDTREWWEILRHGDPVMTVHIPSKGRMGPEECGASFRQAVEFYGRHFPEVVWRAFTCHSWLLDPQFEQMHPAPPNIVAWLREWYLHPAQNANDQQTWERTSDLFGKSQPDWLNAEPRTSIQRALVSFVKQGGRPRSGASVLFPEDLDWGAQTYRAARHPGMIP